MAFSYQKYREANKVRLQLVHRDTKSTRNEKNEVVHQENTYEPLEEFYAYTTQDFDINIGFNMTSGYFDKAMDEANAVLPIISKAAGAFANATDNKAWKDAAGLVSGMSLVSYSRHGTFTGTKTLKFPVTCYLAVVSEEGTYQSEVLDNLKTLIRWLVPSRGTLDDGTAQLTSLSTAIAKVGTQGANYIKEQLGDDSIAGEITQNLVNAIVGAINMANNELGKVYSLKLPDAFTNNNQINFYWGDLKLEDVLIRDLTINVPTIRTADNKPDEFEIKFNIETAHIIDTSMLEGLYSL